MPYFRGFEKSNTAQKPSKTGLKTKIWLQYNAGDVESKLSNAPSYTSGASVSRGCDGLCMNLD